MNKVLKKLISFTLTAAFTVLSFASCSGGSEEATEYNSDMESAEYKIGICQYIEHAALDSATKGFQDALKEKLGDKVAFDYKNATGDRSNAATICSMFVADKYDLIFANSTNALAAAAHATAEIPVVGCSVTDFASTLGYEEWNGFTSSNVTGTSDLLPLELQADVIHDLFPDAKNIGILFCSSETNSKYQSDAISEYLTNYGYTCTEYTFVDTTDVMAVTEIAAEECDVIYTPTDNTVAANTEVINNILEPAKIPLVAGNNDVARECGIATVGIEYYDLGYKAGLMAYEILCEDADPGTMSIEYADNYLKRYVPDRCKALGITVPDTYRTLD